LIFNGDDRLGLRAGGAIPVWIIVHVRESGHSASALDRKECGLAHVSTATAQHVRALSRVRNIPFPPYPR
jgi:hypothetical protein